MTKTIRILALVAVVQVVVAGVMLMGGNNLASSTTRSQLFAFDNEQVDKLVLKSRDATVELVKADGGAGGWQTSADFPVNQAKVTALLDKLKELKTGFPVATSASAYQRFKLADDDFERHISVEQDGKALGSLYLGSGAGARRSYVRYGDDPAVYSVTMGAYDAPGDLNEWLDKTILQLNAEALKTVQIGEVKVEKIDGVWKVNKLPEGKSLDTKAIDDGLSPLLSLRFDKLLGKELKPEYGLDKPELTIKLAHKEGEREYRLAKLQGDEHDGEHYVLKTSDRPEYLQLAAYTVKPLLEKLDTQQWFTGGDAEEGKADTESANEE